MQNTTQQVGVSVTDRKLHFPAFLMERELHCPKAFRESTRFPLPLADRSSDNMRGRWIWRLLRSDGCGVPGTSTPHGRLSSALRRGETKTRVGRHFGRVLPAQAYVRVTHPLPGPAHKRKATPEAPGPAGSLAEPKGSWKGMAFLPRGPPLPLGF